MQADEIFYALLNADQPIQRDFIILRKICRVAQGNDPLPAIPGGVAVNIAAGRRSADELRVAQNVEILLRPTEQLGTNLPFLLIQHIVAEIQLPEGGAARRKLIEEFAKLIRGRLNGFFGARGFYRISIDWIMII